MANQVVETIKQEEYVICSHSSYSILNIDEGPKELYLTSPNNVYLSTICLKDISKYVNMPEERSLIDIYNIIHNIFQYKRPQR